MLEPLRNPVNWDNFRKGAVLVLILSAAAGGDRPGSDSDHRHSDRRSERLALGETAQAPGGAAQAEEDWGKRHT
jgi:hypothetical protein